MAIYFYYGEEDYNIEQAIEKLKQGLDKNFADTNYKKFDALDFPNLMSTLSSQGSIFGKTLTVINCKNYFEKNTGSINFSDTELKELDDAIKNKSNEISDIVFYYEIPRSGNNKLDKRKKIFKTLSKAQTQEFLPFTLNYYGKQDLTNWIKKQAKSKDISVDNDVAELLIEQIGNNLREFNSELDKLKLLAYPQKTITKDMVKEICITNEDFFNFTEVIMSKDFDKALFEYQKLLDKKHPLEILSATQTILRKRILLKLNSHKSMDEIVAITGMSAKQVNAILKNSGKQTLKNLVHLKEQLTNAEYRIKAHLCVNEKDEVQNAIMQ